MEEIPHNVALDVFLSYCKTFIFIYFILPLLLPYNNKGLSIKNVSWTKK